MDDGILNLDTTLGEIFPEEQVWTNVTNTNERKNITIQEMLTMTTGISGVSNPNWFVFLKPCGGRHRSFLTLIEACHFESQSSNSKRIIQGSHSF